MDSDKGVGIKFFEMLYELTKEGWSGRPNILAGLTTQFTKSVLGPSSGGF